MPATYPVKGFFSKLSNNGLLMEYAVKDLATIKYDPNIGLI